MDVGLACEVVTCTGSDSGFEKRSGSCPVTLAQGLAKCLVRQLSLVLGAPMRIDSVPPVAAKTMTASWADAGPLERDIGVTAETR